MEDMNKRTPYEEVKKYIGEINNVRTCKWHKLSVDVKYSIPMIDALSFIEKVVDNCFADEGKYTPEYKDYSIRAAMVMVYTNLDLPTDTLEQYAFVYNTDIAEWIYERINQNQFDAIVDAIEQTTKYRVDVRANEMEKGINEFINAFDSVKDQVSNLFGDITRDDVVNVVNALSSGEIDEERLIKSYLSVKQDEDKQS